MILLAEYIKDPCGTLSIPYYKAKSTSLPEGMRVVHERDFRPGAYPGFSDERYFRLIHRLEGAETPVSARFFARTADEGDIPLIADMIRRSYSDIGIAENGLHKLRSSAVFDPELWAIVCETESGRPAACGIAELDREAGEGSLEWIQTLPEFRRMGAGEFTVRTLLSRLKGRAGFATVSGRADGPDRPEKLYRKCGFTGNDIWHVLRKT